MTSISRLLLGDCDMSASRSDFSRTVCRTPRRQVRESQAASEGRKTDAGAGRLGRSVHFAQSRGGRKNSRSQQATDIGAKASEDLSGLRHTPTFKNPRKSSTGALRDGRAEGWHRDGGFSWGCSSRTRSKTSTRSAYARDRGPSCSSTPRACQPANEPTHLFLCTR